MSVATLTASTLDVTPGSSWNFSGNPTAGGSANIASGIGNSGDKLMYLRGLSAGIPLDARIDGIEISLNISPTGGVTFQSDDFLKVNFGYITDFSVPVSGGVEKTTSLNGLGAGSTVVFGGSTDQFGKAFWSRYQLMWGGNAFGVSVRRLSSARGIIVNSVTINIYYTLSPTLVGSRAPVPKDTLSAQADTIYPLKTNGVDDTTVIRSSDINALGDALYNLEKSVVTVVDDPNTVQAFGGNFGESLIFTNIYVTGVVTDFSQDLYYDETNSTTNGLGIVVRGLDQIARTETASIPNGKSVDFEFVHGHAWATNASGAIIPLNLSIGGLAIQKNGSQQHRLTFRATAPLDVSAGTTQSLGGYAGMYAPVDGAVSAYSQFAELNIRPDNIDYSPNIPGFTVTYNNGATPNSSGAQGFKSRVLNATDSFGLQIKKRYVGLQTVDQSVTTEYSKGVKFTNTPLSKYDYVNFTIAQAALGATTATSAWEFTRAGLFVWGTGTPTSLSGYGVMLTRGPNNTSHCAAWLVKFVNWDSTVSVSFPNYNVTNGWQSFPWPGGNTQIQNIGNTYVEITPTLAATSNPKNHRIQVSTDGSTTTVILQEQDFLTGTWSTIITGSDFSSPYIVGGKSGLFMVSPNPGVPRTNVQISSVLLGGVTFGYLTNYTQQPVKFEARIMGIGRLK